MSKKYRKSDLEGDWTSRYLRGELEGTVGDDVEQDHKFSKRSKFAQQNKMQATADFRAGGASATEIETLPLGQVIQVHSLYIEVQHDGATYLCTVRSTLQKLSKTAVTVGDWVRFRVTGAKHVSGFLEATIDHVADRKTILIRQDSFRKDRQDPLVANAQQILIVASILMPRVKWGLVDRILIAAESGGLKPVVCINKIDLANDDTEAMAEADAALGHYQTMGIATVRTSVEKSLGMDELRGVLKDQVTVLSGHSGVGKSSLIRAIAPDLDIKIGLVSTFNEKGRHTTTGSRQYKLPFGGTVIDTPGIKQFGLWNITADNLEAYFPDVAAGTAPSWRMENYAQISKSIE